MNANTLTFTDYLFFPSADERHESQTGKLMKAVLEFQQKHPTTHAHSNFHAFTSRQAARRKKRCCAPKIERNSAKDKEK